MKYNLLYRSSRDGFSPKNYHNLCDGNENTICIIKTNKGCKFEGFTISKITCATSGKENDKGKISFVFSLDKLKTYKHITVSH